jgi:hypothetical protein
MGLTLRQVSGLLEIINHSHQAAYYSRLSIYAAVHKVKIPSYSEFSSMVRGSAPSESSGFDKKSDEALDKIAMEQFKKRQMAVKNGQ